MIKRHYSMLIIFLIPVMTFFLIPTILQSQDQEKDNTTKEYVEVVNVEMILRAMRKGQPVSGLKKSDLVLLEDGKEVEITSFTEYRRKIGTKESQPPAKIVKQTPQPTKKRFFLFYFWIAEEEVDYKESLDFFFDKVYRPGDLVLLVLKHKAIKISRPRDIKPALQQLEKEITITAREISGWIRVTQKNLQRSFNEFSVKVNEKEQDAARMEFFLNDVRYTLDGSWKEYQYKYLTSNAIKLTALANSLKDMNIEKWGVVYYQHNVFPTYDINRLSMDLISADNSLKDTVEEMVESFNRQLKRPPHSLRHIKRVQQAFIDANATFHLLMPGSGTQHRVLSRSLKFEETYSDWKESFRQISQATGGEIVDGDILKASLQKVVEREDIYYRLTYRPEKMTKQKRKIKIKTKQPGLKIYHISRVNVKAPTPIEISSVDYKTPALTIALKNYHCVSDGDLLQGEVRLTISATNQAGKSMEYSKILELNGKESQVTMNMRLPKNNSYRVTITALDTLSGQQAQHTFTPGNQN
ncbi:MAG: hypothetical protein GY940_28095 [bacterium]|nr:hypothetical protein [bacterium]